MTQRWLVRVASHARHGGGHVARSGTLARALAASGADVVLRLDPDSPEARARLEGLGLRCTENESPGPWSGSVLDGYELMTKDAEALARVASPLVVLDDFLSPPACAALAVNGAFHLNGEHIGATPALLGPRYALVDPRYADLPARERAGHVRQILVTMGRLDPDNLTGQALETLARTGTDAAVTVVASADSAWRAMLSARIAALGTRGRLVLDAPDMAPLMAEADFVIGAGGVSLMERMAAGVPSLTLLLADNQQLFVEGAAQLGATIDGGGMGLPELTAALKGILEDGSARAAMAAAGRAAIDGQGAARVAQRLTALAQGGAQARQAAG